MNRRRTVECEDWKDLKSVCTKRLAISDPFIAILLLQRCLTYIRRDQVRDIRIRCALAYFLWPVHDALQPPITPGTSKILLVCILACLLPVSTGEVVATSRIHNTGA